MTIHPSGTFTNSKCFPLLCTIRCSIKYYVFFFFNDTATTEIYTLSLHDALPISTACTDNGVFNPLNNASGTYTLTRSEEHTSELQSQSNIVCRLLLEKKNHNEQVIPHVTDEIKAFIALGAGVAGVAIV